MTRQLVLNVFFMRFGHHPAAWRSPGVVATGRPDIQYWINMAKLAEEAQFDAFFMADFIGRSGEDLDKASRVGELVPVRAADAAERHRR